MSGTPVGFGFEDYKLRPENEGGAPDTQAGSHPFQLTTTLALNRTTEANPNLSYGELPLPVALPKDLRFKLPPGLVGNATVLPQCTDLQFTTYETGEENICPPETAVGVASVTINEPKNLGFVTVPVPVFNLAPKVGEPARFGFEVAQASVILDTAVRTGEGYGVTVSASNVSELVGVLSSQVTFWGVPGDPRHDQSRGWGCVSGGAYQDPNRRPCNPVGQSQPTPFLTLPTSCTGPLQTTVEGNSWAEPANFVERSYTFQDSFGQPLELGGCNQLAFDPSIEARPETTQADTPTGLDFNLKVPQESTLTATGLAEATVRDATVTLPPGMSISPSSADGLQSCSDAQFAVSSTERASCPSASQIGSVQVITPLLSSPLDGELFLGEPLCGNAAHPQPCGNKNAEDGSLFRLFLQAQGSGVTVKLAGAVTVNAETGQVTTSFREDPQLPFSELKLDIKGGPRAPLANPQSCAGFPNGPNGLPLAVTTSDLTPWSTPFTSDATPSSGFEVSGCIAPMPFGPSFSAGTATPSGGAFSPFTLTLSRRDGEQNLSGVSVTTPPGLLGMLSAVPLCPELQASQGTCGPQSLIGHTQVGAGAGSHPFFEPGNVFLTGPYKGQPFGLSIVTQAQAGPFNLGTIVVRSSIHVDPHTSALTITSDPLPRIIDGVPLRLQTVNVTIDKRNFMFNPTNCRQLAISGTITGASPSGAPASGVAVSSPFAAAGCKKLSFSPKFVVSTPAHSSKAAGAGLTARLFYPKTAQGTQADIAKVKVDLPKQLPSQLKTLQKACVAAVFEANPENCPKHSIVGRATVHTPVLPVPLTGKAYFVSHGGEAFPSLTMVLQGDGVTIDLVGSTFIHGGITSTTFKSVPDVPFETFELTLFQGEYAALTAYLPEKAHGSFCGQKLSMPTAFVAQNGAEIHESTPIRVTGCSKQIAEEFGVTRPTIYRHLGRGAG